MSLIKHDISGKAHLTVFLSFLVATSIAAYGIYSYMNAESERASLDESGLQIPGSGATGAYNANISRNGNYIVFETEDPLVAIDTNGISDIYRYNVSTGDIEIVSLADDDSIMATGTGAIYPSVSRTGRYVVFQADATDLGPSVTSRNHVYMRDMDAGTTILVSAIDGGTAENPLASVIEAEDGAEEDYVLTTTATDGVRQPNYSPITRNKTAVSEDGRYVVFLSTDEDLSDTPFDFGIVNSKYQVYRRDTVTNNTKLVTINAAGTRGGNSHASMPTISDDGNIIVWENGGSDLLDPVVSLDITRSVIQYRDMLAGTTKLLVWFGPCDGPQVGVLCEVDDSTELDGNDYTYSPAISGNGKYIIFETGESFDENDFEAPGVDTAGERIDVYIYDVENEEVIERVSEDDGGATIDAHSNVGDVSNDGDLIAFLTDESLKSADDNNDLDAYIYDRGSQELVLASEGPEGVGDTDIDKTSMSSDGGEVTFSTESALVEEDTNGLFDVYFNDDFGESSGGGPHSTSSIISVVLSSPNPPYLDPEYCDEDTISLHNFLSGPQACDDEIRNTVTPVTGGPTGPTQDEFDALLAELNALRAMQIGQIEPDLVVRSAEKSDFALYVPTGPETCMAGDLNHDFKVDMQDLSILAYWQKQEIPDEMKLIDAYCLNADGRIDKADLSVISYYWGDTN